MILSEFIQRVKLQVPNIGNTGVTDPYLRSLINKAVDQANLLAKVYSGYTDFNIEAEKRVYDISTIVPFYLGRDKRGLFIKDINGKWTDVIPKTEAWLSERYPDYLNSTSVALPEYYYILGDELGFYPQPSTSIAGGARLYHLKKSTPMTNDNHYPFKGSTVEVTAFTPLDDAIIAYCKWKLSPAFGAVTDQDIRYREFAEECRKGAMQIKRSPDIMNDSGSGMEI